MHPRRCRASSNAWQAQSISKRAVSRSQVIINRAESSAFPSDYCGVVTQRSQFSFVKNGVIPSRRSNAAAWERARKIARIAHEGMWNSAAEDSLYFHATYVKPSWARKKVARATIKTHIFYR